jgi:hypothetical protein
LATFTWPLSPWAQATVASNRVLYGLIGAIAITVPLANGPTLVGPRAGDHGGGLQEGPREAHDVIDLQVDRPWK